MATGYESLALLIGVATVLGIIAQKTRQPKVIAYILAGLIMGPVGFNAVQSSEMTSLFSELGLVFLLFLIGLEIDLDEIREVFTETVGIGLIQMALTFVFGTFLAFLLGFNQLTSVFIGASVMFSSTALVVKLLTNLDESSTLPGRLDVGILLVQDIVVVIILALMTVNFQNPGQVALKLAEIFLMISVIGVLSIASSKYLFSRILNQISDNKLAFFTHGVAWAFAFISIAQYFNLSLEIGAFLAGIGLAQIPYSRELQERVRPLTDLFMAIFFINFGIGITGNSLYTYLPEAVIASVALVIAKFIILFTVVDRFKFTPETSFKTAANMTQVSEFGLILISLAITEGFVAAEVSGFISMTAILTMGSSAYLIRYKQEIMEEINPLLKLLESEDKTDITVDTLENHAVVIGYSEMAQRICRELEDKYRILVIDKDSSNTNELANSDYEYIYGDFRHGKIREGSNLGKSDFIISFSEDKEVNTRILEDREEETVVIVKSKSFEDATELYDLGADYVILENLLAGNRLSEYLELYLEDRELLLEETEAELNHIRGDEGSQN